MNEDQLPLSPTRKRDTHYNMKHLKRGMALIFNHDIFKQGYATPRPGTNVDCKKLISCLGELGFDVIDYHNLSFDNIRDQLQAVAGIDHTNHDCLIVVVLTHGDVTKLFAQDKTYDDHIIWSYFTADKCRTLAGKPKMFFIQACRGQKFDDGSRMMERTETDSSHVFRIPCHADFLMAYATIPGHYSWRIPSQGSWFIEALCSELRLNGREVSLLTLLTFVCQRVALDLESYDPADSDFNEKKQIPCIESRLTRLVQF